MKISISWLVLAIVFAVAGLFLVSTVRKYLVDAKNAQG
jgi:hypothetical protein